MLDLVSQAVASTTEQAISSPDWMVVTWNNLGIFFGGIATLISVYLLLTRGYKQSRKVEQAQFVSSMRSTAHAQWINNIGINLSSLYSFSDHSLHLLYSSESDSTKNSAEQNQIVSDFQRHVRNVEFWLNETDEMQHDLRKVIQCQLKALKNVTDTSNTGTQGFLKDWSEKVGDLKKSYHQLIHQSEEDQRKKI